MSAVPEPICRRAFDAQKLVAEFPPRLSNANKQAVYRIACPPGSTHAGQVVFSRWARMPFPAGPVADPGTVLEVREDYFGYEPPAGGAVEWYLNFAHEDLFCAYGGSLFAQDEMQVAEHPALGSLREALLASDLDPLTVAGGEPTPVLVTGVERRCRVATGPDAAAGRPNGLYGNAFARAKAEAVERATTALVPPTVTNLIAMEAPPGGDGRYTRDEIEFILATAFTGFAAARAESQRVLSSPTVVVHTGYWGCGAYGGNRVLMAVLQVLAVRLARLDRLVFHAGDAAGAGTFLRAKRALEEVEAESPRDPAGWVERVEAMGFEWGVSDGN
jgi:hypothetical protein